MDKMDKMWWNEQWMGYPIGPWYSENSNVYPASTLQVVAELVKHNKYFEQMYLPGHGHNLGSDYITKRIYEFFWKNIKEGR
jgi:hypothetical protein